MSVLAVPLIRYFSGGDFLPLFWIVTNKSFLQFGRHNSDSVHHKFLPISLGLSLQLLLQ